MSRILDLVYGRVDPDRTPHSFEGLQRLAAFSDGVVAIAITLVVLPLVDVVGARNATASELFGPDRYKIVSAALTFVVIGSFWLDHHATLEPATTWTRRLASLDLMWLAAIAFLPVPTALLFSPGSDSDDERLVIALYAGTTALGQLMMRLMEREVRHHCGADAPTPSRARRIVGGLSVLPMTLVMTFSFLGPIALLLLLTATPLQAIALELRRRQNRVDAAASDRARVDRLQTERASTDSGQEGAAPVLPPGAADDAAGHPRSE